MFVHYQILQSYKLLSAAFIISLHSNSNFLGEMVNIPQQVSHSVAVLQQKLTILTAFHAPSGA